jgi:hypothetical protein
MDKTLLIRIFLIIAIFSVAGYFIYVRFFLVAGIINRIDIHNRYYGCGTITTDEALSVAYGYSLDPLHWANLSNVFNKTWQCTADKRFRNISSITEIGIFR